MPCEKCGGSLRWLMMTRMSSKKDIETNYLMCEKCETIYRQIIHTKIELKEIQPTELFRDYQRMMRKIKKILETARARELWG